MGLDRRTVSDDASRLSRIKSLIDRDMRSVRAKTTQQLSPQQEEDKIFEQRRQQLEAQDLTIRQDAQKQRKQRQLQHRQHLISEAARENALKEQKQKQEAERRQKENAEKKRMLQQMRNTIPSPQGMQGRHEGRQEGRQEGRHEKNSEPAVLELTQIARQGLPDRKRETLSRGDARLYSPFAHTKIWRAGSQKRFTRSLSVQLLNFFFAPFLLLWRFVLLPYRIVNDLETPSLQGAKHTIATVPLACWHFATAPLHLLAHAVLDPLGLFAPQMESYPRLSPSIYARIFAQQIKRNFLGILRAVGRVVRAGALFLTAPFLLLANVVLLPWRSVRYGTVRNVASILAESGARIWRKARIRSVGSSQLLRWRTRVVFRAQRERSRKIAGEGRLVIVRLIRKELAQARRNLPALWRAQRERIRRSLARLSRARRTGEAHRPFVERPLSAMRTSDIISDAISDTMSDAIPREQEKAQEKAKEEGDEFPSVATGKAGLFSESENSLLEDFFANDEKGQQSDMDAFSQVSRSKEDAKPSTTPTAQKESKEKEGKEALYREMDTLRSAMQEGIAAQNVGRDEKKIFQEVEEMDEEARAKLLQQLSRRVEEEKLR